MSTTILSWSQIIKLGKVAVVQQLRALQIEFPTRLHYFKLCSKLYQAIKAGVDNFKTVTDGLGFINPLDCLFNQVHIWLTDMLQNADEFWSVAADIRVHNLEVAFIEGNMVKAKKDLVRALQQICRWRDESGIGCTDVFDMLYKLRAHI